MRHSRWFVAITAMLTLVMQAPGVTDEVVEMRLRGHFFAEPATLNITVTVQPHELNRLLRIEADSLYLFRSSDITLDGEAEKRLHTVVFKNLSAGAYVVSAQVISRTGVRGRVEQEVIVTGTGVR